VQKAALLLLDQPPRPRGQLTSAMVLQRVTAADAELRQTALRLLENHLDWAEPAANVMRGWLKKPQLAEEEQASLPRLLLAFQAQPAVQHLIAETIGAPPDRIPLAQRLLVLQTLAQSTLSQLPPSWAEALAQALQQPVPALRLEVVRTAAVLQMPQLDDALARLAESAQEARELRIEALRAVVPRRPNLTAPSFELLLGQAGDKDSPVNRLAAAEILGRCQLTEGQLGRLLQAVRGEALLSPTVLLPAVRRATTNETAPALLDYLAESLRLGWRPSEEELEKVLEPLPPSLKVRATAVRELWRQRLEGQRARLAQLESLLHGGNAEQGKAVFFGKKAACVTCHRLGTEGGQVGPDLTRIGTVRSGRDLLEAIVLPSSTIVQEYENYFVATADGRSASGVIARRTSETVVLRDSSGGELRLRKDQIQEMTRLATSLMPEGLERTLTAEDLRDLLAFLRSLK
jgi:putative heme-binding domain-containing protein